MAGRRRIVERGAAWAALGLLAAAVGVLVAGAVRNLGPFLLILLGLLAAVTAGWYAVSRRGMARWIALGLIAVSLVPLIWGIVAALECRSETGTALTTASFDSPQMNWAMFGEFALAVLVTQMDAFRRLLGTTEINMREFAWALIPAIALLALWELGKLIARRRGYAQV